MEGPILDGLTTHKKRRYIVTKSRLKKRLAVLNGLMKDNTDEFCRNTTLHGLKYLTDSDLYPIERIFFAVSFGTVVLASCFFIINVYAKWNTTPVIVGINPQPSFITDEPFPAVTICNLNQAYKSWAERYSIYSVEYAMLQMLCEKEVNVTIAETITDWSHLKNFVAQISQPCHKMILSCRFGAQEYNCSQIFEPMITDEGLCCVFNMVHPAFMYNHASPINASMYEGLDFPVQWTPESGYPAVLPPKFYPRLAPGTGESLGLSLVLNVESDEYYCSSANSVGFKILLHSPTESPDMREIGLLLSAGRETKIRLRTDRTESDKVLRSLHWKYRKCLFENEKTLSYFSHYSHRNCEFECTAKMLMEKCGCISHYMPSLYGNESICSIYDSSCVEAVRLSAFTNTNKTIECHDRCLPSCYDVGFMPDFFSTPLAQSGFQVVNRLLKNMSNDYVERNIAVAHMYFKEHSYRGNKQTEFIGITDFLSSVGGLIGLFFGFSFISFAEFIYYAIIRPCRPERFDQRIAVALAEKKWNDFHKLKSNKTNIIGKSSGQNAKGLMNIAKLDSGSTRTSVTNHRKESMKIYPEDVWFTKRRFIV